MHVVEIINGSKMTETEVEKFTSFFSLVSGITVMGDPSEIYSYGTLYWLACFCAPFVGILNNWLYLPVFYELQITSIYEVNQSYFYTESKVSDNLP
jgi:Na+/proline symporter